MDEMNKTPDTAEKTTETTVSESGASESTEIRVDISTVSNDTAQPEPAEEPAQESAKKPTAVKKPAAGKSTAKAAEPTETQTVLNEIHEGIRDATKDDIAIDVDTYDEKIRADEMIPLRSMVRGGLNWKCPKSGISYRWNDMGAREYMLFEDLYNMYTNYKHYLTKPYIIVEDERVIRLFKLIEIYKSVADINRLEPAMNSGEAMEEVCRKALSVNMRDLLVERLIQLRTNKILTNIDVITAAETILDCEIIPK